MEYWMIVVCIVLGLSIIGNIGLIISMLNKNQEMIDNKIKLEDSYQTVDRYRRDLNYFIDTYYTAGDASDTRSKNILMRCYACLVRNDMKKLTQILKTFGSKNIKNRADQSFYAR